MGFRVFRLGSPLTCIRHAAPFVTQGSFSHRSYGYPRCCLSAPAPFSHTWSGSHVGPNFRQTDLTDFKHSPWHSLRHPSCNRRGITSLSSALASHAIVGDISHVTRERGFVVVCSCGARGLCDLRCGWVCPPCVFVTKWFLARAERERARERDSERDRETHTMFKCPSIYFSESGFLFD